MLNFLLKLWSTTDFREKILFKQKAIWRESYLTIYVSNFTPQFANWSSFSFISKAARVHVAILITIFQALSMLYH